MAYQSRPLPHHLRDQRLREPVDGAPDRQKERAHLQPPPVNSQRGRSAGARPAPGQISPGAVSRHRDHDPRALVSEACGSRTRTSSEALSAAEGGVTVRPVVRLTTQAADDPRFGHRTTNRRRSNRSGARRPATMPDTTGLRLPATRGTAPVALVRVQEQNLQPRPHEQESTGRRAVSTSSACRRSAGVARCRRGSGTVRTVRRLRAKRAALAASL